MTNGLLNVTSILAVMEPVTQEPAISAGGATDGMQQRNGVFAEMLSGMAPVARMKTAPDSGQEDLTQTGTVTDEMVLSAQPVDLLMQLHVSALGTFSPDPVPAEQKQEESGQRDASADSIPLSNGQTDVSNRIVLAAYSQPGRMPTASIPTQHHADLLQKVAAVEQPVAVSVAPTTSRAEATPGTADVNTPIQLPVDRQQNAAIATEQEQPPITTPVADRNREGLIPVEPPPEAVQQKPAVTAAEKPDAEVMVSGQSRQKPETVTTTTVTGQPVTTSATPAVQAKQSAAPEVQTMQSATPVVPPEATVRAVEVNTSMPVSVDKQLNVIAATEQTSLNTTPAVKNAAEQVVQTSEATTAQSPVTADAVPQESELEIKLSQSVPITARATAAPVLADVRPATQTQEIRGNRKTFTPGQQIENIRTGEQNDEVKEMVPAIQTVSSGSKSEFSPDTSPDGNQEQQNSTNNPMLMQTMHGQSSTEQPKATAAISKAVPAESVHQDMPEHVFQQVKERLVQHDVKPGSQQITLTLSPDSLGELKMNLNLQGQRLSVEIITENRSVRDVIVQHTEALKESLARQSITMESFDVTTGGKGSGNQGQNQNAWREMAQQQQQQQFWASPRNFQTAQADLPSGPAPYQRQQGQSMLDIHY